MTRNIQFWAELETYFPTTQTSNSVHLLPLLSLFYFCETLLQSTCSVHVKYAEHNLKVLYCRHVCNMSLKNSGVSSSFGVRGE